ncbi:FG-GAP repeat [Actinomyces bovis]|uniref:FG-GAP repeat n=1 Tax=Actinomyces bovis TaxID=1658 RepID=A0ABY1VM82_9ACTO|nr:FG-GAP repeat protein [Actinomyces bovis]SPT52791.1 FG-GAP repeat [Actinomyces bovis]VEG54825.1 FG-GAP repeat [Actinomyces israelii]
MATHPLFPGRLAGVTGLAAGAALLLVAGPASASVIPDNYSSDPSLNTCISKAVDSQGGEAKDLKTPVCAEDEQIAVRDGLNELPAQAPAPPVAPAAPAGALAHWYGSLNAAAGASLSQHACDVTGDGRQDIITSAWLHTQDKYGRTGALYIIPNGAKTGDLDDPATGAIKVEGPRRANAMAGINVSCVGDVNGDGVGDIGVSDQLGQRGYVVFGSAAAWPKHLDELGERGFVIEATGDRPTGTGYVVTGAGDLNSDGLADVAVVSLAGGPTRGGEVTVVSGRSSSATVNIADDSQVLLRVVGTPEQRVSAFTPAGDVDGDGISDFLFGGYVAKANGAADVATGMGWLVSGTERGTVDLTKSFKGFTVNGPLRGKDRLGISVAALGDINGDGFADILFGAEPRTRDGGAAVVLGSASRETVSTDPEAKLPVIDKEGSRGWWLYDSRGAKGLGYSISAVKAAKGSTGTILLGAYEDAKALAIDTSALTGSADVTVLHAKGGRVDLAALDAALLTSLQGDGNRLGRAVGVLHDFNEHKGKFMLAGADNTQGRGSIVLAKLPATHSLAQQPAPERPEDGGQQAPPSSKPDNGQEQNPPTSGPSASAPAQPQPGDLGTPGTQGQNQAAGPAGTKPSGGVLSATGVSAGTAAVTVAVLLLVGGVTMALVRARRRADS